MLRSRKPSVEALEERFLLYTTTGNAWAHPERITYSLMPNGTSIGGTSNVLNSMVAGYDAAIKKAAAEWEDNANLDIVQVSDDGSALGVNGNQQSDSRFGDIRIGAMPQSMGQLGFAYQAPPANGGTNAGDFFLNSSQSWQVNGNTYDVRTVALHEFGHSLGLGHSLTTSAVMYATYHGLNGGTLTGDDVSGIQAIYGVRPADSYEGALNNNAYTKASDLTGAIDGNLQVRTTANFNTNSDVDWYKVTVPNGGNGSMTIQVQAADLSSVLSTVEVFKATPSLVSQGGATTESSYGWTYTKTLTVSAGETYYIKTFSSVFTGGTKGTYGVLANFGNTTLAPIAAPNTYVAQAADGGGGSQGEVFEVQPKHHEQWFALPEGPIDAFKKKAS